MALLFAGVSIPILAGFFSMYALLYRPCNDDTTTPSDYGHAWEDVTLKIEGKPVQTFFIPGTNGATVIIPPPTNHSRGSRFGEANLLAQHGYAVLTFESRCCADLEPLTLGYREAQDVRVALDYLLARDDVDPARIGILGFSSAGATSIMAAAQYPEIRAVVAEGGYGDFAENAVGMRGGNILTRLYKWSLGTSYHLFTGIDIDTLAPVDVIGKIAPRHVLLIYGSEEPSLTDGHRQLDAAGPNTDLWIVEGAHHGSYMQDAPDEFERRVIAFFDQALLNEGQ